MTRVTDFLDRFRPAAAPGPAGQVGVPGDRRQAAERELEPVFAALAKAVRTGEAVRKAADRAGRSRVRDAVEQARGLVATAEREAKVDEADAAARTAAAAALDCAAIAVAADAEAAAIRARTGEVLPTLIAEAVRRVRAEIAALDGSGP